MAEGGFSDFEVERNSSKWNETIETFAEKYLRLILRREIDPTDILQAIGHSAWKPKTHEKEHIKEAVTHGYGVLDVSLLYTLLRNVARLHLPSRGWGKDPYDNDITESDDIERIRLLRNGITHKKNLPQLYYLNAFKTLWSVCQRAMQRAQALPFEENMKCFKQLINILEKSTAPSKPNDKGSTANSINISWTHRSDPYSDFLVGYEICYSRMYHSDRNYVWRYVRTKNRDTKLTIRHLKSNTEYVFKVRALYNKEDADFVGPFGQESDCVKTKETPANKLVRHCSRRLNEQGNGSSAISYHKVLLNENVVQNYLRIRRLVPQADIGQCNTLDRKTVLLVGAESSGKTSFVNAVLNFMYDVSFDDDFRLLSEQEPSVEAPASHFITKYVFPRLQGAKTRFSISIVDLPGLTGDAKKDTEIIQFIRRYYEYCNDSFDETIDFIGYVMTESHMQTSGPEQDYILRGVLDILGSDLKDIVHIILTSSSPSENENSPVVKALHKLHIFSKQFRFNNIWLHSNNEDIARNYWEMSSRSFHDFTVQLERNRPKTFTQSHEALKTLNLMKHLFWSPHPFLRTYANQIASLRDEKRIIEMFLESGSRVLPVLECNVHESWDVQNEALSYNCTLCNVSCLYPCYNDRSDGSHLGIIDRIEDTCLMCNCCMTSHVFERKFYRLELRKMYKTLQEVEQKYNIQDTRNILQHVNRLLCEKTARLNKLIYCADQNLKLFQAKSARMHVISIDNAIDFLIQEEQFENSVGTEERIRIYSDLKRKEKND